MCVHLLLNNLNNLNNPNTLTNRATVRLSAFGLLTYAQSVCRFVGYSGGHTFDMSSQGKGGSTVNEPGHWIPRLRHREISNQFWSGGLGGLILEDGLLEEPAFQIYRQANSQAFDLVLQKTPDQAFLGTNSELPRP